MQKENLTLLTDFYELTMAGGYFETKRADDIAYFDLFFRRVPDGGGFAVMAGLEQVIEYLSNLQFSEKDIAFLRTKNIFTVELLALLFSLVPMLLTWLVPRLMGEASQEELFLFVGGATIYIVYPLLSLILSFICSWTGMDWYIAILSVPCAYIFAGITYFPFDIVSMLVYCPIYALLGAAVAFPVSRYKKRKDADARYLGKKL